MGPEETEKSLEEIVGMIKQGDLSLAPKLYEQTKGIICYVVWREWRREHIRRGAKPTIPACSPHQIYLSSKQKL